jgi:carbon storage regulator CsrA
MLVLSRREGQRVLFPDLDISVQVLPGKGSSVRLGIDAPAGVNILREELAAATIMVARKSEPDRHELRGRLNAVALALNVVEKQLKAGLGAEAECTLREAQVALEGVSQSGEDASRAMRGQPNALLVEDNPNEEALLSCYLRLSGCRVESVHDGQEAIDFLVGRNDINFLLLDMHLPRLDGPATIAAIRRDPTHRGLTIFAVTGSSPGDFDVSTGEDGVDAWFQKPLNPKRIVDAIAASRN